MNEDLEAYLDLGEPIPHPKRELEVGMIVKINPFKVQEAYMDYSSMINEGDVHDERKITRLDTYHAQEVGEVEGGNYWQRKNLLIKGVDYHE
jgi:hypothetical protein